MSCPACECDACLEAHPMPDELVELHEANYQREKLNLLWRAMFGREPLEDELVDVHKVLWATTAQMIRINGEMTHLNAGLHRLMELIEGDR